MSMKRFIYRKTHVFEYVIMAWSKEHAEEMMENGDLAMHPHEMECVKDEEKIVRKVGE